MCGSRPSDAGRVLQLLRRFSRDAVALRLKHLSLVRRGAESHTIVVMVSNRIEVAAKSCTR